MNSFSGIKDVDREILLAMTDEDLLKTCSLNKYLFNVVCDDNFFYRRLLLKYPDTLNVSQSKTSNSLRTRILKYYNKEDGNYKSYYLKVIYYISKMQEDYNYSYVSGNPEKQYHIFKNTKNNNIVHLLLNSSTAGEINLVKEAIKRGADIHSYDDQALRNASYYGHLEIVKYLVSLGANIHTYNDEALRLATANGHLEI